ncbi:MAG: hypothetical protein QXP45_01180 [Thermoproteota archaeon]
MEALMTLLLMEEKDLLEKVTILIERLIKNLKISGNGWKQSHLMSLSRILNLEKVRIRVSVHWKEGERRT